MYNTNRTLFLAILSVTIAGPTFGQMIQNVTKVSGEPIFIAKYEEVEGNPYLGEGQWAIGRFVDRSGTQHDNLSMRYNAYDDVLEVKQGDNVIAVEKSTIQSFEFISLDQEGKRASFLFKNGFPVEKMDKYSNFRVLFESDVLTVLERVRKIQIKVTPAAYGEQETTKFVSDNSTYIIANGKAEKSRISVKSLSSAFPQYKSQIKEFAKSRATDFSAQEDIRAICQYIVELDRL